MNVSPFLLLIIVPWFGSADEHGHIDPDEQSFLMSISMGRGLYWQFPDVRSLNATNFEQTVKGKDFSWVIEFYNSWCGHCIRFTSTYKRLAVDIKGWSPVVKVGAVDCSNQLNTPLCRDYEIFSYPTVRYFPPQFSNDFYGTDLTARKVDDLRETITHELHNRTDLPQLHPSLESSSSQLWSKTNLEQSRIVLVTECKSFIGPQLVLDYWSVEKVKTIHTSCGNTALLQNLNIPLPEVSSLYVLERDGPAQMILNGMFNRSMALAALHPIFESVDIKTPTPFNVSSIKDLNVDLNRAFDEAQQGPKKINKISANLHTDEVFQVDIEGAMRQTLNVEIPSHKHITNTAFTALQKYITLLKSYFPIGQNGRNFLQCLFHGVKTREPTMGITGVEFADEVGLCQQRYHPVYLDPDNGWIGCRGSSPMFRGYPCSLWTMFHTLAVQAYNKKNKSPQQVLQGMRGYIGNFFGCSDCAQHFLRMAATMEGNVTTNEDSVLWLWSAHNSVNKRLHGDQTEDPQFPKVQFPPPSICAQCHYPNGLFNEKEVLAFLLRMYTNISYIVPGDLGPPPTPLPKVKETSEDSIIASKLLRHQVVVEQEPQNQSRTLATKLLWDFSLFDVSLCVILYVISMGIIILVCIKFLKNRPYRKKPYYTDIF